MRQTLMRFLPPASKHIFGRIPDHPLGRRAGTDNRKRMTTHRSIHQHVTRATQALTCNCRACGTLPCTTNGQRPRGWVLLCGPQVCLSRPRSTTSGGSSAFCRATPHPTGRAVLERTFRGHLPAGCYYYNNYNNNNNYYYYY